MTSGPLDHAFARVFLSEMQRHAYTYDQISALSGVSRTRAHRLLAGRAPFYVGDVQRLTDAFELDAATVLQQVQAHMESAGQRDEEL